MAECNYLTTKTLLVTVKKEEFRIQDIQLDGVCCILPRKRQHHFVRICLMGGVVHFLEVYRVIFYERMEVNREYLL